MENQYMQAQCKNMMAMIAAFTQGELTRVVG